MVDVVVGRVVRRDQLEWVPGKVVATVIVHSLDSGHGEEPHCLT